jgi:hypothetical protein
VKNFVYRYRARNEHLADLPVVSDDYFAAEEADIVDIEAMLAMVGAQSCTPTPHWKDSTAHWLPSRRYDGPAAYPAVAVHSPARVVIHVTTAVDQTDDSEKAHDTANVGFSEGSSGYLRPRRPSVSCTGRGWKRSSTS